MLGPALSAGRVGSDAELRLIDITEVARNPSRFLAMESGFADRHANRTVRIVSQLVWPGRTADECLACMEHEALINGALMRQNVMGLCLYDVTHLADDVLADACRTHPVLWKGGSTSRSDDYAPDDVLAHCNQPLPPHPGAVTYTVRAVRISVRRARSLPTMQAG